MSKRINTDSAKWKLLMDKIITKIPNELSKRLEAIEKNDLENIQRYQAMGDEILHLKVSQIEKNIVSVTPIVKY